MYNCFYKDGYLVVSVQDLEKYLNFGERGTITRMLNRVHKRKCQEEKTGTFELQAPCKPITTAREAEMLLHGKYISNGNPVGRPKKSK